MLQLSTGLVNAEANKIVKKFINDRLIGLMEEIIMNEVTWDKAMSNELSEEDRFKPFDDLVDMSKLMTDKDFAENVSLLYLPDGFPVERANQEFFGLYRLLKAKKEYVPELVMEYILYHVIYDEVGQTDIINEDTEDGLYDELMDDPFFEGIEDEEYTTVMPIPEPDRGKVLNAIREQYEGQYAPEEMDDKVNYFINLYEDLREYDETCFEDTDFLLLDKMSQEEIIKSGLDEYMGIIVPKETRSIEFPVQGKNGQELNVKAEIYIHPWDLEDED